VADAAAAVLLKLPEEAENGSRSQEQSNFQTLFKRHFEVFLKRKHKNHSRPAIN